MLNAVAVLGAKPRLKAYKLADSGGLFLFITPTGGKYWRYRFKQLGKEKTLALGVFPATSLKDARERVLAAKKQISLGLDPCQEKKRAKNALIEASANTFEGIAREWIEAQKNRWTDIHRQHVLYSLGKDVFPALGDRPVSEIKGKELLDVLRKVEARGVLETAGRLLQRCSSVFKYSIQTGRAEYNPALDLKGALKPPKATHFPALAESELPELLRKIEDYQGDELTRLAMKFLSLTFVRSGEMRAAEKTEFNLEAREWRVPESRMKMGSEHIVPLSDQALAVLADLWKLNPESRFVFPNSHNPMTFMSENTVLFALYRMGYRSRMTAHGFRSCASTILNERREENGFSSDAIERQLSHTPANKVRAAYHRGEHLPERKRMMQWWGDYIDRRREGAKVLEFKAKG